MRLAIIGVLCLLISACWQQDEVISIESNGDMKWLVIAHPDWEFITVESVEKDVQLYTSMMRKAGWEVRVKGSVSENKDVVLGLIGNLHKVDKQTNFYKIHSVTQALVKIEFLCPLVDESRVLRSIKVKNSAREAIRCNKGINTFRF